MNVLAVWINCWNDSVSQKSSRQPCRYDAQTSFPHQKKSDRRSTVNSQLPSPGAFRLSRPQTGAKASCFQHNAQPLKMAVEENLNLEAEQDSPQSSLSKEASPEVNWEVMRCTAVWGSSYPILWLSFLSVTRARNLSQFKGFRWMFLPPLPFYALRIFFPIHFLGIWFCYAILMASAFQKN